MPISSRRPRSHTVGALLTLAAVAVVACGEAGECLRFSDCDQGLTCAFGHCVLPPPPETDGAAPEEGGTTTTVADTGSTTVITPSSSDATTDTAIDAGADATSE